jgi:signal transduction histidine kinase
MTNLEFLAGGGRTGALMRALDWSSSPLGRPDTWPPSLRTIVALLQQSQFPMFVAWGKDLGFLYNDPYAEILGAKHPRAMGRRFYDIWSEIWPDISPLIDAAMAGQASFREDLPLVMNRKGCDEKTWFTFSYSPVRDESDTVAGMFCAVQETTRKVMAESALLDLTATLEQRVTEAVAERLRDQERLRHAEAALRQTQKMEAIGQLTGGVAHDFNNLLAVFATGLQLLERDVSLEQRQRIVEGMRRAVARGTGLTRHLLAFTRRRPVNPESIEIAAHLRGMREMLHGSLGGHLRVDLDFGTDVWPVEIDAGEMELAILNLCLNARDAMPDGGAITITAANVQESDDDGARADFVKLSVADTGCGMPADVIARVFEPFFTTKDVGKGSGLGLPQVYGFAHQSGGRVSIQSEVGAGTIVTLLLPRSLREPAAAGAADLAGELPARSDGERQGHVLLVEDDREVSALTREMLSCLGFSVTHVTHSDAALGALANGRAVDVVLSDIMMPGGVSGLELAREIGRRHPDLPVILTTGYVEAAASMTDGEFELLLKPYSLEELAGVLGVEVE